jgi:hypothetical protein
MIPQPNMDAIGAVAPQQVPPQLQQNFQQGLDALLKGNNGQAPIQVMVPPQPGDPNFVMPANSQQPGQPPVNPGGVI